jgi:hypothetical protein
LSNGEVLAAQQVVIYTLAETYLEGWYTRQALQEVLDTMDVLMDAKQVALREKPNNKVSTKT